MFPPSLRSRRSLAPLVPLVALAACDIPSGVPEWDTTWNVPSRSLDVGVGQVLPAGVTVAPDGAAFLVQVAPATIVQRLADDCGPCAALAGRTAPSPEFTSRRSTRSALPATVASGTLAAGTTVDLRLENGQTFDPLRPNGASGATGYITLVIRAGETVLGRDSIDGRTAALPAHGGALTRRVTLGGGTIAGHVDVDVVLHAPEGAPALIDPARTIVVTATPSPLRVSQARVSVRDAQVSESTTADLDVSGGVADRVRGGRLLVDVRDPFGVRGTVRIRVTAPGTDFTKPLVLDGTDRAYTVEFSRDELRAMLGKSVTFTFAGPVSTADAISVSPSQAVRIGTRFELTVSSATN